MGDLVEQSAAAWVVAGSVLVLAHSCRVWINFSWFLRRAEVMLGGVESESVGRYVGTCVFIDASAQLSEFIEARLRLISNECWVFFPSFSQNM